MKLSLALAFIVAATAHAQIQMPPGTTSPVPDSKQPVAPTAESAAVQAAEESIGAGKYADAVALLRPLAKPTQKNERVFYDLAFAQDALNNDKEAAAAYRNAVSLKPEDVPARVSLGLLLARTGNVKDAEEQLTAATQIPGADKELQARAYRALAQIHFSDPAQAIPDLVEALKLSPETPDDAAMAAELAESQHNDAATEKAYAHASELNPADIDVAVGYARVLSRRKQPVVAETVLKAALQSHPQNHVLLAELASEQLLNGQTEAALPSLTQLHSAEPGNAAIAQLLARAFTTAGEPDKAYTLYESLLKSDPDDVTLLSGASDALIRLRRSPEAEPLLQRALAHPDRFPNREAMAQAAGELAFAASSNKDYETVLAALATRNAVLPSQAAYVFLAASAHDALHHTKAAQEQYHLFLQQSGGSLPDQEWQAKQRLQILDRAR
ncbi:tetratricopeptide repeat protein [Terriglobus roseus]|uniref:tetratricopeptide repeat protein n=1 Tax=Terriglobus roseus TaxID=392734 RepID=UPI00111470A3|nr:tetratricopeptide repeat protein [Terriglobus roseus]